MGRIKRPYGAWSQSMLEALRQGDALKAEAFLAWLADREIQIDRTLLSHWAAGRSHLPADLLPCLAEFTARPELVFGPYLRAVGCEVVRLPESEPNDGELTEAVLAAGAAVGQLQHAVLEARAPASPGGQAITDDERRRLQSQLAELIQRLAELRVRLGRKIPEPQA